MQTSSPLEYHLLEYLGEDPFVPSPKNLTTVLRHGQVAQEWLVGSYLATWLELIGGLIDCDYPLALRHRVQLRAISRLADQLDPGLSPAEQVSFLVSVQTHLQSVLRRMSVCPSERDLQWGIWGRDVPTAIAHGFVETDLLSPVVCEGIAPCCMYAALLVSQCVTDEGVAEEIEAQMFEGKPRSLLELLRGVPEAPEA